MALDEYKRKRNFSKTPEPDGSVASLQILQLASPETPSQEVILFEELTLPAASKHCTQ